jgi:hypothetical protein
MRARRRLFPWILAALAGCGGAPATPVPDHPPSAQAATAAPPSAFGRPPRALGADAPEAADVSAIVGRYRDELGAKLSVPVGRAEADITPTGEPSNALGQLVADEMLAHLRSMPEHTVDLFVTNDGGLRTPLYGGQILLRHVYEVMPFDNELVVLELDGATVQRILDLVARKGGEPLAGARLVIDPTAGRAHERPTLGPERSLSARDDRLPRGLRLAARGRRWSARDAHGHSDARRHRHAPSRAGRAR